LPKPKEKVEDIPIPEGLPPGKVQEVSLSDINLEDAAYQYRVVFKVLDLIKSIKAEGQQFPIILRGEKPYQIVSGFRRVRACQELGLQTVKAIIREDLSDDDACKVSFIENEKKKNLSPLDKAYAVEKLRTQGKSPDEIAVMFGLSRRQVMRYQEISKFPSELKKAIGEGKLMAKHGLLLNAALRKAPNLDLKNWLKEIQEENLSTEDLKKRLSKETRKIRPKKKFFEKRKDGFRIYPFAYNPESTAKEEKEKILEYLETAVEMLKR